MPYFGYKAFNFDIADYERLLQQEIDNYYPVSDTKQSQTPVTQITIKEKGVNKFELSLDKVTQNLFKLQQADLGIDIPLKAEKKGSKKQASIIMCVNIDTLEQNGVGTTRALTAFDNRCYDAVCTLYNAGFDKMTVAQIYNTMGRTGRPGTADIKKINESLTKMRLTRILIDNTEEIALNYKYPEVHIKDTYLLPIERDIAIVNGQLSESTIKLIKKPALFEFAAGRGQITTLDRKVIGAPLNQTPDNLQIQYYFERRISQIKNKKAGMSNRILFATVYDALQIKDRKRRTRAKEKIISLLDYYKKPDVNFIKDYKATADGVTIYY